MDSERFRKQLDFILESDKEKEIFRQTHLTGYTRRENDAEHAWHMAMMAYLLKEYANEPFDLAKTMMMILIHDIVEIDAGDTYAYDEEAKATQEAREQAAADRLFGLLPEDQEKELRGLFEEFEACETPEARFARVMDNFQPLLLNDYNSGKDWERNGICKAQILKRNEKTKLGSEEIYEKICRIIDKNVEQGHVKP